MSLSLQKLSVNKNCQSYNNSVALIINKSLMRSSFVDYLGSGFKIKGSDVTPKDSIILSRSAVAILLVYTSKVNVGLSEGAPNSPFAGTSSKDERSEFESDEELIERLKTFYKNHQKTVVVMVSAVFGEEELTYITSRLMLKLLPRCPLFLVAHGEAQAACHVQMIAKATQVEARQLVQSRILEGVEMALSQDIYHYLATIFGISEHEMSVLMDTFKGSLKAVAAVASADEIHRKTPLDRSTAEDIFNFLKRDSIIT